MVKRLLIYGRRNRSSKKTIKRKITDGKYILNDIVIYQITNPKYISTTIYQKHRLEIVIHCRRSNPFDNKKDDIDSLKNKLHLSLNIDNQDHDQCNKDKSPSSVKEVKDIILASSKSILGKVLSPTKEKYSSREKVRRDYTD